MKHFLKCAVFIFLLMFVFANTSVAVEGSLTAQEKGKFSANLLLPSPSELFVALDKLGKADWGGAASFNQKYDYNDNYLRALNLGMRAADGFLAIQARDKSKLGEMIVVIMTLAEELMVEDTILEKGKTFKDLSREERWDELHNELDSLREDVIQEMDRMGDKDVALLVSAGGWIEGLRATSEILMERYDARASSILYQPRLVEYFSTRLDNVSPKAKENPAVKKLMSQLDAIGKLVDVGYKNPVPMENIKKLHVISSDLVTTIEKG